MKPEKFSIAVVSDAKNEEGVALATLLRETVSDADVKHIRTEHLTNLLEPKMLGELYRSPEVAQLCWARMAECATVHLAIMVAPYGPEAAYWAGYMARLGATLLLYSPDRSPMVQVPFFAITADVDKVLQFSAEVARKRATVGPALDLREEQTTPAEVVGEKEEEASE